MHSAAGSSEQLLAEILGKRLVPVQTADGGPPKHSQQSILLLLRCEVPLLSLEAGRLGRTHLYHAVC